jgi:DNA-binding NarL/FixJ family response regulator
MTITDFDLNTIRIVVADDQNLIRQALQIYLQQEHDLEFVGYAEDGNTALEAIEHLAPDVVILDLEMPGMDGLTTIQMIRERFPATKILVFSSHDERQNINLAVEAGAKGYLIKGTPLPELADAIRSVHRGYFQLGPGLLEKFLINSPVDTDNSSVDQKIIQLLKKFKLEIHSQCQQIITSQINLFGHKLNEQLELKLSKFKVKQAESNSSIQKLEQKIYCLAIAQLILLFMIVVSLFFRT